MTVTAAPSKRRGAASAGSPGERPPGEPRLVGYLYLLPAFAVFACFVLYRCIARRASRCGTGTGSRPATWAG